MLATAQGNLTVVGPNVFWKGRRLDVHAFFVRRRGERYKATLEFLAWPDLRSDLLAAGVKVKKVKV